MNKVNTNISLEIVFPADHLHRLAALPDQSNALATSDRSTVQDGGDALLRLATAVDSEAISQAISDLRLHTSAIKLPLLHSNEVTRQITDH